jgi:hypothetical protein
MPRRKMNQTRPAMTLLLPSIGLALLLAAGGCGQPREGGDASPPGGTPSGSTSVGRPMSMEGSHEDTDLPKRFQLDGKTWEIMQDIDAPAGTYEKGSEQVDGKPVYHDRDAAPPYTNIYLKVEGKDRFLQYAPLKGS